MIKRYAISLSRGVEDVPDGNWVKFEDHEREVQKLTPETKSYYSPHDSEENITDNPKSWIAWKKRSEQLAADKRELVEALEKVKCSSCDGSGFHTSQASGRDWPCDYCGGVGLDPECQALIAKHKEGV